MQSTINVSRHCKYSYWRTKHIDNDRTYIRKAQLWQNHYTLVMNFTLRKLLEGCSLVCLPC